MPVDELTSAASDGELTAPDDAQVGTETAPPDYGPNNKDLPEDMRNLLKDLAREFQGQEKYGRRREVMRDSRNRFYSDGLQHLFEQGSNSGIWNEAKAGGSMGYNDSGSSIQAPNSVRNYNIFFPFERTVTAVLTQNPPGVDFQPDDPNESDDVEAADVAEGFRRYFDRCNDVKDLQQQIVRYLLLSGRTVSYTFTEENPQEFGYEKDGKTPKKVQTTRIYGTIESKCPILSKSMGAWPYCVLSDDVDVRMLKEWHPDFADDIKGGAAGIGENDYERIARLRVMQGSQIGEAKENLTTRQIFFFRPACFNDKKFEEPSAEDGTLKDKFLAIFPEGCRVVFCGEAYCGSWAESMDDHVYVDFPFAGDGMNRKAAMDPMVVIQDDFNDDMNAYREVGDYGWPRRYINAEADDLDAIPDEIASPYAYSAHKAVTNQPLAASFFQEPDPNIPTTLWQKTIFLMSQLAQFILAAPPSLQGDSSPDLKTASAYAQAKAQAMGQQGIPWMAVQRMFARIYYQAAKCAFNEDDGTGQIVVPSEAGTPTIYSLAKLKGNFGVYPDQDSSFPESTAAKRANLMQLFEMAMQSPIGPQLFGSPDNITTAKNLLGFAELVLPEDEARDKQLIEIKKLLGEDPIKPPEPELQQAEIEHAAATIVAQKTGQPLPPPFDPISLYKSSVTPQLLDNHEWEFAKCVDFLSSGEARRYEASGGDVDGLLNVRLHAMEHAQMAPQKAALLAMMNPPPPMPMMPPGKGQGGPPKPPGAPQKPHASANPPGAMGAPSL